MILSLTTRYMAANNEDFDVLVRLLAALGVEGGRVSESRGSKRREEFADFFPPRSSFHLAARVHGKASTGPPDLWINVDQPMLALEIVKKIGCEILPDSSADGIASESFQVKLPSGAVVQIGAQICGQTSGQISDQDQEHLTGLTGNLNARGKRFGVVVSRFNAFITERLLQGAFDGLVRSGAHRKDITIARVPGAFEIPAASRNLAETKKYHAILCIGCLLRGDTAHYDVIVNEVTRGIGQSAQETGVPHAFGVLTCDTLEQAIDRAGLKMGNKGLEAAMAAVEMANLQEAIDKPKARRNSSKRKAAKGIAPSSRPSQRKKK
jgi:6,7-dimethyl-8-ribityllumazine synthase